MKQTPDQAIACLEKAAHDPEFREQVDQMKQAWNEGRLKVSYEDDLTVFHFDSVKPQVQ